MKLRSALGSAAAAIRVNFLPGLLLQCLLLIFLSLYVAHDGTKHFFGEVARVKKEAGYPFAFWSYIFAAAFLPELLRIIFFQSGKPTRHNLWLFLTAAPAWGVMGLLTDFFYGYQIVWFGRAREWSSILPKVLVDQFVFSLFLATPLVTAWFTWRNSGFRKEAWTKILSKDFIWDKIFPIQVAGWCIWLPSVTVIYIMHPLLQIPVAVLILCFWALIFTTLGDRLSRR